MTDQIAIVAGELEHFSTLPTSDQIEPVDIDRNHPLLEGFEDDRAFAVVQGIATFKEAAEQMRNRTDNMHQREVLRSPRNKKQKEPGQYI